MRRVWMYWTRLTRTRSSVQCYSITDAQKQRWVPSWRFYWKQPQLSDSLTLAKSKMLRLAIDYKIKPKEISFELASRRFLFVAYKGSIQFHIFGRWCLEDHKYTNQYAMRTTIKTPMICFAVSFRDDEEKCSFWLVCVSSSISNEKDNSCTDETSCSNSS